MAQQQPNPTAITTQQQIFLQAESLDFFQTEKRLVASGKVIVTQGETRLFADRIEMDTERGVGTAWGHVRLLTPIDDIQASRLDFNLTTEQGLLYDATGVLAQVYQVEGERIERLGPTTAMVHHGRLTTCTNDVPDWQFRTREATVDRNSYVSLKHPSLWIKGLPVFYLPYFYFPIKDERTTGFLPPRLGYTSNDGAKVRQDFFWAITDWMDSTIGVEYLSERGFLPQIEYRYALDPQSDGRLNAAYIRDQKHDTTLWRVELQQQQEFGWGVRGLSQIDLRSNGDLLRGFSNNIGQESQVSRSSFGDLTKRFSNSTLSLGGASIDGIPDSGSTEQFRRLPALRFQQFQIPLFGRALFALDASYSRLSNTRIANNTPVQRLDFFPHLTLPLSWAPWIRLTVSGGMRETFYDRQAVKSAHTTRELIDLRANLAGPTLRRTYTHARSGQTFIHTIESRLAYRYVPKVSQHDIPSFEALDEKRHFLDPLETLPLIDRIEAANYAKLSLVNRLFVRTHRDDVAPRIWEAARLTLSQGFDMRQATDGDGQIPGPLDVELELNTGRRWRLVSVLRLDTATGDLEKSSARMAFSLYPGWDIHLAHNYRQHPDVQYLSGGINAALLKRFRLGYDFRYDGLSETLREHHLTFSVLAQCWSVEMAFRFRNTEDASLFSDTSFVIQVRLFNL
ncbi:MAG: LPS assembly protein LptD [bacterium]|nr:LPS assembly protein LptD [bacterium]